MSKILVLIKNEYTKSIKKTSTKIMIILTILSLFLAVGFSKLMKFSNSYIEEQFLSGDEWKKEVKAETEQYKKDLETVSNTQKAEIKSKIEVNELALENNIDTYYSSDWKATYLTGEIKDDKYELYSSYEEGTEEYYTKKLEIEEKIKNLKEDNFEFCIIDSQIKELEERLKNGEISKEEYNDSVELKNLEKKYQIGKDDNKDNQWKQDIITELGMIKETIRTGIDTNTGKIIKTEKLDELKETEKIDIYRLENNISTVDTMSNYRSFYDYMSAAMSMFFVGILTIMLAGSAISSEVSKGTIKFWVMTPNKRWKILFAKLANIIIIILCLTVVLSLLSTIIGSISFSEEPQPYLYVENNEVHELNSTIYKILNYLTYDIDILVYTIFALMLSTLIRNTALSVGVTVAAYAGSGMIMELLNMFIKADWLKFIPFNNMNLTDKIFKNSVSYLTTIDVDSFVNNVSLGFSITVLIITSILMLVTTFDSFNKRDIV